MRSVTDGGVLDEEGVLATLDPMDEQNVDFDDAYLALWASRRDEGVGLFRPGLCPARGTLARTLDLGPWTVR